MKINVSKELVKRNINVGDVIISNSIPLLVCNDPQLGYFALNLNNSTVHTCYYRGTKDLAKSLHCQLIVRGHNLELSLIEEVK